METAPRICVEFTDDEFVVVAALVIEAFHRFHDPEVCRECERDGINRPKVLQDLHGLGTKLSRIADDHFKD